MAVAKIARVVDGCLYSFSYCDPKILIWVQNKIYGSKKHSLYRLVFMPVWHKIEPSGMTEPQLRIYSYQAGLQESLWGVFLISEWCRRTQTNVDGATPGRWYWRGIREQAEQANRKKPVSSIPLWSLLQLLPLGFCLELLSWLPLVEVWVK